MMAFNASAGLHAAELYWNPGGTGGDGIWGTSPGEKNWNVIPGAPAGNIAWPDTIDDVAVFQDPTGGVVTLAEPMQTAGILQKGANYTINAGVITLVRDSASTHPYVDVQGGVLTVDSVIAGTHGLIKNGSGALALTGINTYDGITRIEQGSIKLSGSLASGDISISSGASLINQSGGLSVAATLANAGTLTLDADDSISTYLSNGGTLTAGTGVLFTSSTALNNGSTVAGLLHTATLTSDGAVDVSGTVTAGGALIQSGTFTLSGTLASDAVGIAGGAAVINQNGGLSGTATLTNAGSLTLGANETIAAYVSNGGTLTAGPGTLSTATAALNNGSTLAGLLNTGTLTSNGAVLLSGSAVADTVLIQSGTHTLSGTLASDAVNIAGGASLINQNGGLSNTATLTNAGSLLLNADERITSYVSNGGTFAAGPGALSTNSVALNDGSTVNGWLKTGGLVSNGNVRTGGTITADQIEIASGKLTNTGTLGTASTHLNLNQGATLVADGSQRYSLLTTSGAGAANWRGDLKNTSIAAPGGSGDFGILAVRGDFSQSQGGTLKLDLSADGNDLINVSGGAKFNGSLVLNQSGSSSIAPFVPVTVVSASGYQGNITSFSENLDGAVWFNPGNGTVTRIDLPKAGPAFFGGTRNQTSTWISLYDDVIEPGTTNIRSTADGYDISSGLADAGNPDLLWALASAFTAKGLNAALLNRLSPEVYGGMSDYAMQATRSHQRSAFSAPALESKDDSKETTAGASHQGAKGGILDAAKPVDWEFFAAVDYFRAGTDSSPNEADYDFDGTGVLTGARIRPRDRMQAAVYFGVDSGSMSGDLIDADAFGWNFGVTGEYLLDEKSRTRIRAAMSYGDYRFEGSRESVSATAAGWAPGHARFDDLDVDAFDLFIGVDGIAWKRDALTLIPSAGLRYAMTTMDSFNESTGGAAGSPIALDVNRDRNESLLMEFGLLAQVEVNSRLALWGESGVNVGLLNQDRALDARFSKGARTMRAEVRGLDDDSLYLGCGAIYQITPDISAGIGYRADIRSDARPQQELRISSSWRF